jgi:hypothetical protein
MPSGAGPGAERSGFTQNGGSFGNQNSSTNAWTRLLVDAFQMGMRSSRFSGSGGPGGGAPGGGSFNAGSLFEMGSRFSQDLGAGKTGAVGTALGVLPKLNQKMNSGLDLPVGSSKGKFDFSYRDQLGSGSNPMGGGIGRGSAQASYNSNMNLKHDMLHFSAAAMFGGGEGGSGGGPGGGSGGGFGGGSGSSFMSSGGSGSFGSTGLSGSNSGMFSTASSGMGAGIGSGSTNSMSSFMGGNSSSDSHGGGQGGMGGGSGGGAGGMGGPGGGQKRAGTGPTLSLKLSF